MTKWLNDYSAFLFPTLTSPILLKNKYMTIKFMEQPLFNLAYGFNYRMLSVIIGHPPIIAIDNELPYSALLEIMHPSDIILEK